CKVNIPNHFVGAIQESSLSVGFSRTFSASASHGVKCKMQSAKCKMQSEQGAECKMNDAHPFRGWDVFIAV
ncbi:MAG: hypothetical protein IKW68_02405, partial [Clostridia bacterium]|nr:hypothetical protein [Clostridia bacterium]